MKNLLINSPPENKETLLSNANALAGITLQQLADRYKTKVPSSTTHAKGWTGRLLEVALGANAANKAEPDFTHLGIELKTIPLDKKGKPKESTYICLAQLEPSALKNWETCLVRHKLSEVLWIPIESDKVIPLGLRRIGPPILWQPDKEQEKQLKQDWQEIADIIVMGEIEQLSSSIGKYLQIRPKAANAKALTHDKNKIGEDNLTLPRGFYLRPSFTNSIISSTRT